MKKLVIIMPCYNEEEILPQTITRMAALMERLLKAKKIATSSQVCFVNDGSRDKTQQIIEQAIKKNKVFCGLKLSRNFGHQGAILAGMYETSADIYVTIDADLQDNPDCIEKMLDEVEQNDCDIVYGVRATRKTDSFFKRTTAVLYYRLLKLLGLNVIYNHADFRMMTKKAVEVLKQFPERNLFLRAIVPLIGFKSATVCYERTARMAGKTKYPLKSMMALAWNGISNFSIVPLRMVTFLGFLVCFMGLIFIGYVVYRWSLQGTIVGWASTVTIITLFSGAQLLSLGIIGEYLAKVFVEVKKRPLFVVESKTGFNDDLQL